MLVCVCVLLSLPARPECLVSTQPRGRQPLVAAITRRPPVAATGHRPRVAAAGRRPRVVVASSHRPLVAATSCRPPVAAASRQPTPSSSCTYNIFVPTSQRTIATTQTINTGRTSYSDRRIDSLTYFPL
ncbi:hypothetical protein J6590_027751 [Homalodisca vitripennis]|nr:hypothetical protein J6590_027751 [Homalodisca vitripennis]